MLDNCFGTHHYFGGEVSSILFNKGQKRLFVVQAVGQFLDIFFKVCIYLVNNKKQEN